MPLASRLSPPHPNSLSSLSLVLRVVRESEAALREGAPVVNATPLSHLSTRSHLSSPYTSLTSLTSSPLASRSPFSYRFVKNQFNAEQVTTVGAAFLQSPVPLDDSDDKIQFGIWDTAGSERYKALAPMYYRGAE